MSKFKPLITKDPAVTQMKKDPAFKTIAKVDPGAKLIAGTGKKKGKGKGAAKAKDIERPPEAAKRERRATNLTGGRAGELGSSVRPQAGAASETLG